MYRNWVEEYFWDLHQYLKHRKDRRMALENYIQSSHMSEADKLRARREWSTKETALLRRRRVVQPTGVVHLDRAAGLCGGAAADDGVFIGQSARLGGHSQISLS